MIIILNTKALANPFVTQNQAAFLGYINILSKVERTIFLSYEMLLTRWLKTIF